MKKFLVGLMTGIIIATSGVAIAANNTIKIMINGKVIATDTPAQSINNRTMVPLRAVSEALGADVQWDAKTNTVKISAPWIAVNSNTGTDTSQNATKSVKAENGLFVKIDKVERTSGEQFLKPKKGYEFIIVHITLRNDSSTGNIKYWSHDFKLQDGNGRIGSPVITFDNTDTRLEYGELIKGGIVSGSVAFEVPEGDSNLKFIYQTLVNWKESTASISL